MKNPVVVETHLTGFLLEDADGSRSFQSSPRLIRRGIRRMYGIAIRNKFFGLMSFDAPKTTAI
jgi:hypothetical protein